MNLKNNIETWVLRGIIIFVLGMALLSMFGCAALQVNPDSNKPCLPPGVSGDFFYWDVIRSRIAPVFNDKNQQTWLRIIYYAKNSNITEIIKFKGDIVCIDTEPNNPNNPWWVDAGLMEPKVEARVLTQKGKPCQWTKVYPKGKEI